MKRGAKTRAEAPYTGEETNMRKLQNLLAHACVVLSVSLMTLWVINVVNPKMQFLSGGPTNVLLLLLCVCSLLLGVSFIGLYRNYLARRQEQAALAARRRRFGPAHPAHPDAPPAERP